ncbi:hypothetical protein LQE92_11145 [Lacrimispora sp. NSJ-141]|uniref:Phosphotyrosine protein phosphatase I domain-containing protein n=1 Tax=Lientehia hominis TaxID=2897778 RepID=A0AAP2RKM6_9FIRM|nr:hypothetical protein [Lientehia hominis]MCD2493173.1 hypothetical protein [Lientehia hominis]
MARVKKIIFVCTDNTCLSNMAAAVFEGIRGEREISVAARGLVVLFPEPINQKTVAILKSHHLELLDEEAKPLERKDFIPGTLVLTMTAAEKHQVKERFPEMPNIFTLREFTGQEGDIAEPLGGTLADYGACYEHIDLLTKVAAEIIFKEETDNDSVGM